MNNSENGAINSVDIAKAEFEIDLEHENFLITF